MHPKRTKKSYILRKYCVLPFKILRISIIDTIRQDGVEHAGYLAFLSLLSFFPFLIFLISIIGLFGNSEAGIKIIYSIINSAPKEIVQALIPRIKEIISGPPQTLLTIAFIGVIWTASSSVEGCRTILNRAYRVHFPPPYVWRRLLSFLEFFIIIFFIIAAIAVFIIAPSALKFIESQFHLDFRINYDAFYFRQIALFVLLVCSTSLLYYALPNVKQKISKTMPGSILAVTLWIIILKLFSIYVHNFHQFNFIYGSLAGVIIVLMFFYLVSLVFILGAEFNYHYHRTYKIFLRKESTS